MALFDLISLGLFDFVGPVTMAISMSASPWRYFKNFFFNWTWPTHSQFLQLCELSAVVDAYQWNLSMEMAT